MGQTDCLAADTPVALTIAGSDSGGGAGIQADLKTFADFGVFGVSALTCVTAQNPEGVRAVAPLSASFLCAQVEAVTRAFPVAAAKTGMLYSAELIRTVASLLNDALRLRLVVDPVMVATSGARLLQDDALAALCESVLPAATVFTPNLPEAEALDGRCLRSRSDGIAAARRLADRFGVACVLKGGHRAGVGADAEVVEDILATRNGVRVFRHPRLAARETHGTGCVFSAALTAGLARGAALETAVEHAIAYVRFVLAHAVRTGRHFPLGWRRADALPVADPAITVVPPGDTVSFTKGSAS